MRYFTSDTHFGHKNVIPYCERPFKDVDEMTEGLIAGWNERVTPDDEVFVLGDFSFYGSTKTAAILARLNGTKHLIRGNHDDIKTEEKAIRLGFASMRDSRIIRLGDMSFVLSHYPYEGDSTEIDRYIERRPQDTGLWLLHGHVHREWMVEGRQINVGVDVRHYKPISEEEVLILVGIQALVQNRIEPDIPTEEDR